MDKYDRAIKYFQGLNGNFTEDLGTIWGRPVDHEAGCLFQFAYRGNRPERSGCLTLIRNSRHLNAETTQLTREIRADQRIPCSVSEITLESLPVFAEWQRRLDRELAKV